MLLERKANGPVAEVTGQTTAAAEERMVCICLSYSTIQAPMFKRRKNRAVHKSYLLVTAVRRFLVWCVAVRANISKDHIFDYGINSFADSEDSKIRDCCMRSAATHIISAIRRFIVESEPVESTCLGGGWGQVRIDRPVDLCAT